MTTAATDAMKPAGIPHHPMWIGGAAVDTDERFEIRSPRQRSWSPPSRRATQGTPTMLLSTARASFESRVRREKSRTERAEVLDRVAVRIDERNEELAKLQSKENGAPVRIARWVHVGLPAQDLRYFAELARTHQWGRPAPALTGMGTGGMVRQEPVGVVAAIVPWNVPLQLAVNKIGPALAAGNSVVIKPDERAPLMVLELDRADLPAGVFNVVTGAGRS